MFFSFLMKILIGQKSTSIKGKTSCKSSEIVAMRYKGVKVERYKKV